MESSLRSCARDCWGGALVEIGFCSGIPCSDDEGISGDCEFVIGGQFVLAAVGRASPTPTAACAAGTDPAGDFGAVGADVDRLNKLSTLSRAWEGMWLLFMTSAMSSGSTITEFPSAVLTRGAGTGAFGLRWRGWRREGSLARAWPT